MARPMTGSNTFDEERGLFIVRLTHHDEKGKRRDICRTAQTKTEALRLLNSLKRSLDIEGPRSIDGDRLSFKHLANDYAAKRLSREIS